MKQYQYILFDLDGTLTEPAEGITNSVKHALEKHGISVESKEELLKFIGPPLKDSFMEYYHFTEEEALQLIEDYREYFADKGLFENKVYEEIPSVLETLKANGKCLIVATSKPEKFTKQILDHFNLTKYFDFIAGATMDSSRTKKGDIIKYAVDNMHIHELTKAVMVGDRHHDIDGAKENQMDSVGVLYGYGSKEELEHAGATYLVRTVKELESL